MLINMNNMKMLCEKELFSESMRRRNGTGMGRDGIGLGGVGGMLDRESRGKSG